MGEWWRGAAIYQIYPRSFQDESGDGVGDLPGVLRRLPHVASLGVDAIWLSPVFTSPQKDMGYDVSDYCGIDPLFGTLADFDAVVAKAHASGLKVIVDQVLNHSSDRHPWFVESRRDRGNPKADWYVWTDPQPDGAPPNNWLSVFGGPAWEWDSRRRQYYLHHFLIEQPDLNYHNPAVQDAILETVRFWLARGVDGLRLDTVNYYFHDRALRSNPAAWRRKARPEVNPNDMQAHIFSKTRPENLGFLARLRGLTDSFPGRAMVGEVGESPERAVEVMARYTSGSAHLHMAYSFALLDPTFTAAHIRQTVEGFFAAAPDGWPCWSFSNHDVERHASRWAAESGLRPGQVARLAAAILVSLPGSICLYQGEELGQTETDILYEELRDPPGIRLWPDYKGRDGCRTPMVWDGSATGGFTAGTPWLPVKPPQLARNVAAQEADPASVLHLYRAALAFRRARPELAGAGAQWLDLPEPLLGLQRTGGGGRLTCLFNLGPAAQSLRLRGNPRPVGPGAGAGAGGADPADTRAADPRPGAGLADGASVERDILHLPGGGFQWLEGVEAVEVVLRA